MGSKRTKHIPIRVRPRDERRVSRLNVAPGCCELGARGAGGGRRANRPTDQAHRARERPNDRPRRPTDGQTARPERFSGGASRQRRWRRSHPHDLPRGREAREGSGGGETLFLSLVQEQYVLLAMKRRIKECIRHLAHVNAVGKCPVCNGTARVGGQWCSDCGLTGMRNEYDKRRTAAVNKDGRR